MRADRNTLPKGRGQVWIIHALAFIVLLTIPFFINPRHNPISFADYVGFFSPIVAFLTVFYINFFCLIEKFLFKRKISWYLLSNLLIIFVLAFALYLWGEYYFTTYILPFMEKAPRYHVPWYARVIRDSFFMIMAAIVSIAVRMTGQWYRTEQEKVKIEAIAAQAELKNLKSQLNPHFLFNTLNNIYSLMRVDSQKAQNAILELSKILRYVLNDENQDRVLLKDEIAFTRNYIELMSLRLNKNVSLNVAIPSFEDRAETIAPLLFISLVENTFKHGISQTEPSFITIHMAFEPAQSKTLCCTFSNSYFPKGENDHSGSGIGVDNLKKRLGLIYPNTAQFETTVKDGVYCSRLTLNLD